MYQSFSTRWISATWEGPKAWRRRDWRAAARALGVAEGTAEAGGGHVGGGDPVAAVESVTQIDGLDGGTEGCAQVFEFGAGGIALDEDRSGGGGEAVEVEGEWRGGRKYLVDGLAVEGELGQIGFGLGRCR